MKTFIQIIVFGMFFVSCQQESLKNYMTNSWETTYMKIEMSTYQNLDSSKVFEDSFDNNPERIAQSKYNADGTFNAWFVNQKGEKISPSEGKWNVKGDSLFVSFFYNGKDVKARYHISKTEEGFLGKSKSDWDNDGKFDDLLTMKTKKIN